MPAGEVIEVLPAIANCPKSEARLTPDAPRPCLELVLTRQTERDLFVPSADRLAAAYRAPGLKIAGPRPR